ncbi:hypothetical protein AHF37_11642 [Paragonimus kellicotti]|nr:hypothetical protein AHF37_11642 [Paragonimus kellicotti]
MPTHICSNISPILNIRLCLVSPISHVGAIKCESYVNSPNSHSLTQKFYTVIPLAWCPHLIWVHNNHTWQPTFPIQFTECERVEEIWICLICYQAGCTNTS